MDKYNPKDNVVNGVATIVILFILLLSVVIFGSCSTIKHTSNAQYKNFKFDTGFYYHLENKELIAYPANLYHLTKR